ncbi:MAG TPA: hypothetical protein PK071_04395 [Atopobiaceae bacterium]|nr:hypothetical protein [Atopobiaceae bacterium]
MGSPNGRWTDAIIRSVKETLFGDAEFSGSDKGPANVVASPIEEVMRDICALGWDDWRDYAFAREPLNGRLDDAQRAELMERARICGEDWAQRCERDFHSSSPLEIAEKLGATVTFAEKPHGQDRVTFAEFTEPDEIYVYTDALDKAEALLDTPGVREATGPKMRPQELLIAHEVFHLIELQNAREIWTQTHRIDIRFGPFRNPSRLSVLGELAAMSFARTLTGIDYSPYVLDVLLTYAYSPAAGTTLYNEVMGYQRQDRNAPQDKGDGDMAAPTV